MHEINLRVREIILNYFNYSNTTYYQIEKLKIITRKTLLNILKNPNSKITKKTVEKLIKLPNLRKEDLKELKKILNQFNNDKNSSKKIDDEILFKKIDNFIERNFSLKKENKSADLYFENRKINSFTSNVGSRTLLGKKIWELNDDMFQKWGDIKMLLDITPQKDKNEMKKGLLSVASNLREIADNLEKGSFGSEDFNLDEIIDIKED